MHAYYLIFKNQLAQKSGMWALPRIKHFVTEKLQHIRMINVLACYHILYVGVIQLLKITPHRDKLVVLVAAAFHWGPAECFNEQKGKTSVTFLSPRFGWSL